MAKGIQKLIERSEHFKVINHAFPNVGKKLMLFWGYPEFNTLVDDLIQDTRGSQRTGFPTQILSALLSLDAEHEAAFPQLTRKHAHYLSQWH